MKVVWSDRFAAAYAQDPAARAGRLDAVLEELREDWVVWVEPPPAGEQAILRCHTAEHVERVREAGLYEIAALAAGGAIRAAKIGREEPCFALVRPPGHHASRGRAWGFCQFNNLAIALWSQRARGLVEKALVLDTDLHFGDGTAEILGGEKWVEILNPMATNRTEYLGEVAKALEQFEGDWIAVSAGFDNHSLDWGGLLHTEDYDFIGLQVGIRARALGSRCFAVLEGGYNPSSLGESVYAFLSGLERGWVQGSPGHSDRRR